jgi:hypothetical protein
MKMRSQYLPEESRSTIMNFFRIPLNIFVCIVLYNVSEIKPLSLPCRLPLYVPNTPICRFNCLQFLFSWLQNRVNLWSVSEVFSWSVRGYLPCA